MSEMKMQPDPGERAEPAIRAVQTPEVIFDLQRDGAEVLARAAETAPWLTALLSELRSRFPYARTAQPFDEGPWYRPTGHRRAFYRRCAGGSVVAFKGTELLAEDAGRIVAWVHAKHDLLESPLEGFPLLEQKAPGVLLMEEALAESEAALSLQSRWAQTYEGLARTPLPLLVVRWPAAAVEKYRAQIGPFLSDRVRKIVDRLVSDGLAAYVYYYPGVPTRTTEVREAGDLKEMGYRGRKEALAEKVSFERTFDSWTTLVGRILALGFMPITLSHETAGQMVQMQNAIVDGGFVDTDSLQPLSRIRTEREMATTFWTLIAEMAFTVGALLGGSPSRRLEKLLLVQHDAAVLSIFEAVREILKSEESRGVRLDPRLREIVFAEAPFARLDRLFTLHHP